MRAFAAAVGAALALAAAQASAKGYGAPPPDIARDLDRLVAAYPDHLAGHDEKVLIWKDGTRTPLSDGRTNKNYDELLDDPDIDDLFAFPYPAGTEPADPGPDNDPGRIRPDGLFVKMYGDCTRGGVERWLRTVNFFGTPVRVTVINGVDRRLEDVVRDLERLPATVRPFLTAAAGGYNCRPVAGTKRVSAHGYGAAVDINAGHGDYWKWAGARPKWRNRIPKMIVDTFEKHGFIWGGRWSAFDTMHFEYRPELLPLPDRSENR